MTKLRWGILGAAGIAREMIPAINSGSSGEVCAIASRSRQKAESLAAELGVRTAYASYEALLSDPEIDAIYNPLPNSLHVTWSLRALAAGKHVLCEKPLATSVEEVKALIEAAEANRVRICEAFMFRHHPQWVGLKQLLSRGDIGHPKVVQAAFCYNNQDNGNIRNKPELGGGALRDVGCYLINAARWIFEEEPQTVAASFKEDSSYRTDILDSILLSFPSGQAVLSCGTQLSPYQFVSILGSMGRITLDLPFNVQDQMTRLLLYRNAEGLSQGREVLEFQAANQQTLQADAFAQAILNDSEFIVPMSDSLENARVIRDVEVAAKKRDQSNTPRE